MKHSLDTPTITAHALGELSAAETRLLRMTFHDPIAEEMLAEESAALRSTALNLSRILKEDAEDDNSHGLSDAQRERLLALTSAPYPSGKSAPEAKPILTMEKILAERKSFDAKPSRVATYLTAGAAAAVILLLSVMRPKSTPHDTASVGAGTGTGTGTATSTGPDTSGATHFKIVTSEKEEPIIEKPRAVAGTPNSAVTLPEVTVPQGPSLPMPTIEQLTTDIPAPQQMDQKVVKIPATLPDPTPALGPKKEKKPEVYAVPKLKRK